MALEQEMLDIGEQRVVRGGKANPSPPSEDTKVRGFFRSSRLHKEGALGRGNRMERPL